MLVLSRRAGEEIVVGNETRVVVLEVRGGRVRLGFIAPDDLPIHRKEVLENILEFDAPRPDEVNRAALATG